MSPLQIQWDRIRRRWVLILVIGIIAAAGSLGASMLQGTTYTGRAALTIVSQDRAPEQDTVLAQGYADYFNQSASQQELRGRAGIDSDVALNARIAAASPRWDGRVALLHVTDAQERTIQLRALVSAADASIAFELRCEVREKLVAYLQATYPDSLPKTRAVVDGPEPLVPHPAPSGPPLVGLG